MAADSPSLGEPAVPFGDKRRGGLPEPVILTCTFQNQLVAPVVVQARCDKPSYETGADKLKDASSHAGTVGTPGLQKARQKLLPAGKATLCYSYPAGTKQPRWLWLCRQIGTVTKGGCRQVRARGQD